MGAGFAQVGLLLLLTVVGLPLFFFGLMAALDRFERALSPQPAAPAPAAMPDPVAAPAPAAAVEVVEPAPAGTVVALPITAPVAASKSAAAI